MDRIAPHARAEPGRATVPPFANAARSPPQTPDEAPLALGSSRFTTDTCESIATTIATRNRAAGICHQGHLSVTTKAGVDQSGHDCTSSPLESSDGSELRYQTSSNGKSTISDTTATTYTAEQSPSRVDKAIKASHLSKESNWMFLMTTYLIPIAMIWTISSIRLGYQHPH
ncbi:hypothetical protein F4808DRAFT_195685 [Astrocystis sublimbata]|nr:hypothetical protein F4808DRAFT_195685 [Astrocystis sublimbata]